jgi:hypothetical protein
VVISLPDRAREHGDVQLITSSRAARPPLGAILVGAVIGSFLLAGGLFLGWLAFATPVLTGLAPSGARSRPDQLVVGGLIWGLTLVAPPSFAIVGLMRLGIVARAVSAKPRARALTRMPRTDGDDWVAASEVRLPDGRVVRDLVLGSFGMAIVNELPPARLTRHTGISWEIRRSDGRWVHYENPLERTARDGERVRRWIASTERDFVVKVYAVVVTDDPSVTRSPACAVITAGQLPAWLASLPPARALTPDRRADLVDLVRAIA